MTCISKDHTFKMLLVTLEQQAEATASLGLYQIADKLRAIVAELKQELK